MDTENRKIVVLEDDPDTQIFLSTLLKANGFDPVLAADAAEGVELARRMNPACIIVNAMIPDDGGVAMFVCLKCDRKLKAVPVIMLSPVARKIFMHYRRMQQAPDGRPLPEPEAVIGHPPDAGELLEQLDRLLTDRA